MNRLIFFIVAMFGAVAWAQNPPKIAVCVTGLDDPNVSKAMAAAMLGELVISGRYSALERQNEFMGWAAAEFKKRNIASADNARFRETGKQFGAAFICIVDVTPAMGSNLVSVRITGVEAPGVVAMANADSPLKTLQDLSDASTRIAAILLKQAAQAAPQQAAPTQTVQQAAPPAAPHASPLSLLPLAPAPTPQTPPTPTVSQAAPVPLLPQAPAPPPQTPPTPTVSQAAPVPLLPQAPAPTPQTPPAPAVSQAAPMPLVPEASVRPAAAPVVFRDSKAGIDMVFVRGGAFNMGCTAEQRGCMGDELPVRKVTLGDYYIGKHEVTQKQWALVMGGNPSNFKGDSLPVENVSWNDAQDFIVKLNTMSGRKYRLPTEAEWEYAARGDVSRSGYLYAGGDGVDDVAWYADNSDNSTHPVGTKAPNGFGLHDMSGNVWEWVSDVYGNYASSDEIDPQGAKSGSLRVNRGGSWGYGAGDCRVSMRYSGMLGTRRNDLGFRLAISLRRPDPEAAAKEAKPPAQAVSTAPPDFRGGSVNVPIDMVLVRGGSFMMGCTSEQRECYDNERPAHKVTLGNFYMAKYEVTQGLWKTVMGGNPSYFTGNDNLPVEKVGWNEVQAFITRLNAMTGKKYRLPTEAEWEYAARGGRESYSYRYAGGNSVGQVAWYGGNKTNPVGTKQPNELGLYDMSGNVSELVSDWYEDYNFDAKTNPTGPSSAAGLYRVYRGGSWTNTARACRVTCRMTASSEPRYNQGFRLALSQ